MAIFSYKDMDGDELEVRDPIGFTAARYTGHLFFDSAHSHSDDDETLGVQVALDWDAVQTLRDALNDWLGEDS